MKTFKKIGKIILIIICFVCVFLSGCFLGFQQTKEKQNTVVTTQSNNNDITLPGETEERVITQQEVEGKLTEISEFATYEYEYDVEESNEFSRQFLDKIKILGTTNKISIKAKGVVKAGYDFSKIKVSVDNTSKKIYISLPEIQILDSYIIWGSIDCTEKNSILNPIEFAQYKEIITQLESDCEEKAVKEGLLEKGAESIKKYGVIQPIIVTKKENSNVYISFDQGMNWKN